MLPYVIGIGVLCMVIERLWPGWRLPRVRTWPIRVVAVNLVQVGVVLLAGVSWDRWFAHASLLHLGDSLPWLVGGIVAYAISTFVFYWWHRWRHEVGIFWRGFHQIHHSPQRIELITSFYKHPLEMVVNSMIGSALTYALLGLDLRGAAAYTACCALGEFFYHTSVRTPHWVGYIFQRPEMHRVHHQHGRHRNNYGDLVWWDMLFGTFENPREFTATCGFDADREERLGDMLRFADVHREGSRRAIPEPVLVR
jgi:sterol desaturase/sphingolipid hydroxylase (fatty acid hydroxylase superfamily)